MRQYVHFMHPECDERVNCTASGGAEADYGGFETPAVCSGRADQLQRVHNRAGAGELIILVEDVKAEVRPRGSSDSWPPMQ